MVEKMTHLSSSENEVLEAMLNCIVNHANEYRNEVHFRSGDNVVRFSMEQQRSQVQHRPGELVGSMSLIWKLETDGLIHIVPPKPARLDRKGRVRGGEPNTFYFTSEALERYRKRNSMDDAQVRRAIGRYAYDRYRQRPDDFLELDFDAVALRENIDPTRVREQARVLRDAEILSDVGPVNNTVEFGLMLLSRDGLRWAVRGFPDDPFADATVNVTVHVNIRNFIHEVRGAPITEELKQEATDLVKEIHEEPTIEKVSRLFGLAANVHQLAPAVMRFVAENGPSLLQQLPGA